MRQFYCLLAILGIYEVYGAPRLSPTKSLFLANQGSSFEVNCTATGVISWRHDGNNLPASGQVRATTTPDASENISTLQISDLASSHSGEYRCIEDGGADVGFTLKVLKATVSGSIFEFHDETNLTCKVQPIDADDSVTYTWSKEGKSVLESNSGGTGVKFEEKQEVGGGRLLIMKPERKHAGKYVCHAKYKTGKGLEDTLEVPVIYSAAPFVVPFGKSKNLVQDDKLSIQCGVLGWPIPNVTWSKDDEVIEDGVKGFKLFPAETYDTGVGNKKLLIPNARLELESVDFDDKGKYKCKAQSEFQGKTDPEYKGYEKEVLVRVKDKLAALWPFLGIVAEVIILCTIIFIYEKKRNKDAADDDDCGQDGVTPDKKSEGVRHRGSANNPRA